MNSWNTFLQWEARSRQTIDFKMVYVDITGDLLAGLMLSQIIYWHLPDAKGADKLTVTKNDMLWLARADKDWWAEIRLTKEQARRARQILEEKKLIETKVWRFNGDPTIHLRICPDVLLQLLRQPPDASAPIPKRKVSQPKTKTAVSHLEMGSNTKRNGVEPISLTETTAEITSETTLQVDSKSLPPPPSHKPAASGQVAEGRAGQAETREAIKAMAAAGLAVAEAKKLLQEFGLMACQQQLAWLPYRKGVEKPGDYLAWAIREGKRAPKDAPAPLLAKAEAQQAAAAVTSVPMQTLDSAGLQKLGELLKPSFERAIAEGLTELAVTPETHRPDCPVPVGVYRFGSSGPYSWIVQPDGEDLILLTSHLPLFDWPGKTTQEDPR